jgi:predicted nuclease of predicted toxin-antitoxin system
MTFFTDHCVYGSTVRILRSEGHTVIRLVDVQPEDIDDAQVIAESTRLGAVLATRDKEFGNVLEYPPEKYGGIIVLRILPQTVSVVHEKLVSYLQQVTQEEIRGSLIVINENNVRIRR